MPDAIPPHDKEAEQALLGSLLVNREAIAHVCDLVPAEAFYFGAHAEVYRALLALWERRVPADVVTVTDELTRRGSMERIGRAYLGTLLTAVPTAVHAGYYADIVLDKARRRAMIDGATEVIQASWATETPDVDELLARTRDRVERFRPSGVVDSGSMADWAMEHAGRTVDRWEGVTQDVVIPTGFRGVDRLLTGGLRPRQICIVGARPGMGKTSLGLHLALQGPTMFFSMEMDRAAILNRLVSMVGGVPYGVAHAEIASVADRERWIDAAAQLSALPIYVNDRSAMTTTKMRAEVERRVAEDGVQLVVVDHLDHIADPVRGEVAERTATIVRRCQIAAKETGVPWVLLSQLNRNVEHRTGCVPLLSDLRNSGAVEQDADVVLLLYRRRYYSERQYPGVQPDPDLDYVRASSDHRVDVIVAKNRNGGVSSVAVGWTPETMAFREVA